MTAEPAFLSYAKIAKAMKLDAKGVMRRLLAAADEGRIERDRLGHFHAQTAFKLLREEVDPHKVAGHNAAGRGAQTTPEIASLSQSKAAAEQARAQKIMFDLEVRRGNFVPLDQVKAAGQDICARVRSSFASLGHRVAGRVLGMNDPLQVAAIIDSEARTILAELSNPEQFVDALLQANDDAA